MTQKFNTQRMSPGLPHQAMIHQQMPQKFPTVIDISSMQIPKLDHRQLPATLPKLEGLIDMKNIMNATNLKPTYLDPNMGIHGQIARQDFNRLPATYIPMNTTGYPATHLGPSQLILPHINQFARDLNQIQGLAGRGHGAPELRHRNSSPFPSNLGYNSDGYRHTTQTPRQSPPLNMSMMQPKMMPLNIQNQYGQVRPPQLGHPVHSMQSQHSMPPQHNMQSQHSMHMGKPDQQGRFPPQFRK